MAVSSSYIRADISRMWRKGPPTKRPNWKDPSGSSGSDSTGSNGNGNHSYGGNQGNVAKDASVLETFSVTPDWTFVKAGNSYYAEYHGSDWPEQLAKVISL